MFKRSRMLIAAGLARGAAADARAPMRRVAPRPAAAATAPCERHRAAPSARRPPAARTAGSAPPPPQRQRAPPARRDAPPARRPARRRARRSPARLDGRIQDVKSRRHPAQPRPAGARGGAAVPGQHPGGAVRLDGRGQDVRARLGAGQARRQGRRQLSLHAARGAGAAPRRRAARVPRQPEGRRSTRSSRSSPARARTSATTSAAPRSSSRRRTEPKYIELRIKDSTGKLQPEFDVKALAVTSDAPRFASRSPRCSRSARASLRHAAFGAGVGAARCAAWRPSACSAAADAPTA